MASGPTTDLDSCGHDTEQAMADCGRLGQIDGSPGHGQGAMHERLVGRGGDAVSGKLGLVVRGWQRVYSDMGWMDGRASDTLPISVEPPGRDGAVGSGKTRPRASALRRYAAAMSGSWCN